MTYEIEVYKGQTIVYDDENDKFLCDISIQEKYKSAKRTSLKEMRKEIDQFVKINAEFKPFKGLEISQYGGGSFSIVQVEAIRTDGKFIVKGGGNYKSHYDLKDMERVMVYDDEAVKQQKEMEEEKDALNKKHSDKMKEIRKRFKPVDISMYVHVKKEAPTPID